MNALPSPKFHLGNAVATPGALSLLEEHSESAIGLLHRHQFGDWGVVGSEDWETNDLCVKNGARLLSAYPVGEQRVWIITEADRSITTILLPEEY